MTKHETIRENKSPRLLDKSFAPNEAESVSSNCIKSFLLLVVTRCNILPFKVLLVLLYWNQYGHLHKHTHTAKLTNLARLKIVSNNEPNRHTKKLHSCTIQQLNLYCDTKLFTTLQAASLHETTNIVKHHHHRLRYHQTKTSTQTSAKSWRGERKSLDLRTNRGA